MKKYFLTILLFIPTFIFAKTAPFSYIIINETSATSTSVDNNELTIKKKYSCSTVTFNCTQQGTSSPFFATSTTERILLVDAKKQYKEKISGASSSPLISTPLPFTSIPKNASYITKSPDGKTTAFYTTTGTYGVRSARTYWMMEEDTKEVTYFVEPIQYGWDLVSDASHVFSFNASGTILVYLSDRDGFPQLYIVDKNKKTRTLEGKALSTKKYTVVDFVIHDDTLYFIANRENFFTYNLYKLSLTNGKLAEKIADDVLYTNDLTFSGDLLLFTSNYFGVGVLHAYNTITTAIHSFKGIEKTPILSSQSKPISSPFFGRFLKGNKDNKKAIIWLHGGPYRQSANERHSWGSYAMYDWMLEEAHNTGVAILKLDYPGSYGYGSNYAKNLIGEIGKKDTESLLEAITFLKKKGYEDISLFGVSYGGYLALKGGVVFPKKINNVLAIAPVTDWEVLINQVRPTPFEVEFQGKGSISPEDLYKKANIIESLSVNTPPMILMQGNKDTSVPFDQSLYFAKEANDRNLSEEKIQLFKLEGENHVFKDPIHIQNICKKLKELIKEETMSCEL